MGVYEAVRDAISLAQKADNVDLLRKLLEVQAESLADREKIRSLSEENAELRAKLRQRDGMRFEHDVYWRQLQGEEREGPYCPKCMDGDGRTARLVDRDAYWKCPVCAHRQLRPGHLPPSAFVALTRA